MMVGRVFMRIKDRKQRSEECTGSPEGGKPQRRKNGKERKL